MNATLAILLAVALFSYIALNGMYMVLSPVRWASAFWTAKGVYGNPESRERLANSRERRRIRFTGVGMTLLAVFALLTIMSAYL
jgi:hypothetical protein